MGSDYSKELANYMDDWLALTYLKKPDIERCYKRFRKLGIDQGIDQNVIETRIAIQEIIEGFEELKHNPFASQMCKVFSSGEDEKMSFEDFLDMVSAFGEQTPTDYKALWAFKIYDFDGDQNINEEDIKILIQMLVGKHGEIDREIEVFSKKILSEAHSESQGLTLDDFKNLVTKVPDFNANFTLRF